MSWNKSFLFCLFLLFINDIIAQSSFFKTLADSAYSLTKSKVVYDPTYYAISYPNGDVPQNKGVCTDVIIRAYRKLGIDLQKEIHEDMQLHFDAYPNLWKLKNTDKNIDHRRVPNLMTFFERKNCQLPISYEPTAYLPGDIVCWNLGGAVTHIGIVSNLKNRDKSRYLVIHNIGHGQVLEDVLFQYKIIGHYRYKK